MNLARILTLPALLGLTSCGGYLIPTTIGLGVTSVALPASVSPTGALELTISYEVARCVEYDHNVTPTERTASKLSLQGSAKYRAGLGACTTGVFTNTLTYTDSGGTPRTNPFEVVLDGKSWGTVEVR